MAYDDLLSEEKEDEVLEDDDLPFTGIDDDEEDEDDALDARGMHRIDEDGDDL